MIRADRILVVVYLLIWAIGTLLLPWVFLRRAYRTFLKRRMITSVNHPLIADAEPGEIGLTGIVECEYPLSSYISNTPCVWYECCAMERWRKSEYIPVGKKEWEKLRREGWDSLYIDVEDVVFQLRDPSGKIPIDPKLAYIDPTTTVSRECRADDPMYYEKAPSGQIDYSLLRRKFIEKLIPVGSSVHVMGTLVEDVSGKKLVDCTISTTTAERRLSKWAKSAAYYAGLSWSSFVALPVFLWLKSKEHTPLPLWMALSVIYLVIVGILYIKTLSVKKADL